ncbi:hypothetical protein [Mesobacillus zeae]
MTQLDKRLYDYIEVNMNEITDAWLVTVVTAKGNVHSIYTDASMEKMLR